jgi:hypothetical protein
VGVVVIAAYRPKPGKEVPLEALCREHHSILSAEGLVTPRTPVLMKSTDGTLVEVFEWNSPEAIEQAHTNRAVLALWDRYAEVCDYVKLPQLPESDMLFAGFAPLD